MESLTKMMLHRRLYAGIFHVSDIEELLFASENGDEARCETLQIPVTYHNFR